MKLKLTEGVKHDPDAKEIYVERKTFRAVVDTRAVMAAVLRDAVKRNLVNDPTKDAPFFVIRYAGLSNFNQGHVLDPENWKPIRSQAEGESVEVKGEDGSKPRVFQSNDYLDARPIGEALVLWAEAEQAKRIQSTMGPGKRYIVLIDPTLTDIIASIEQRIEESMK